MPPQLDLDVFAFVRGLTPGGSAGRSGRANGMGLAAAALDDANASAATAGSSCQLDNSTWLRRCCGSAWNTARTIRGSLSSAPIQICSNTQLLAIATMSVVVPPTTWDWPMYKACLN